MTIAVLTSTTTGVSINYYYASSWKRLEGDNIEFVGGKSGLPFTIKNTVHVEEYK